MLAPDIIVPLALTNPPVFKLPVVVLPLTDKLVSVPTVVKLEKITPEFSVLPVKLFASTPLAVTPVSCDPLPTKNEPVLAVMLPTALTCPAVVMFPPWTLAEIIAEVALKIPVNTLLAVALPVTFKLLPIML